MRSLELDAETEEEENFSQLGWAYRDFLILVAQELRHHNSSSVRAFMVPVSFHLGTCPAEADLAPLTILGVETGLRFLTKMDRDLFLNCVSTRRLHIELFSHTDYDVLIQWKR